MAWSRTGISVARVWASALANSVTSCPSSTRALVRCATMRSVPPYKLGGTASYSGAICAIFIRCHQSNQQAATSTNLHSQIGAIGPTQYCKLLRECKKLGLPLRIACVRAPQHAETPHPVGLLRARRAVLAEGLRRIGALRRSLGKPHPGLFL